MGGCLAGFKRRPESGAKFADGCSILVHQLRGAVLSDHAAVTQNTWRWPDAAPRRERCRRQRLGKDAHGRGIVPNVAKKLKRNAKTQRQKWGRLLNWWGNRIHFQAPTCELSPEYAVRLVVARPVEKCERGKYNIRFLESLFVGPRCDTPGMLTNFNKHAVYDYS